MSPILENVRYISVQKYNKLAMSQKSRQTTCYLYLCNYIGKAASLKYFIYLSQVQLNLPCNVKWKECLQKSILLLMWNLLARTTTRDWTDLSETASRFWSKNLSASHMSNAQGSIVLHLFPEQILRMVKYRRVVQTKHRLLQICSRLQQFRLKAFLD